MREYMLFLICKKLRKHLKKSKQASLLGQGNVNHLSHKLIQYLSENESIKKKL
jgi:hypothetical protein